MNLFGILFFQYLDFGWSEVYPITASDYPTGLAVLLAVKNTRLAILDSTVSLIAARVSSVDVKGDSYPISWSFPQVGTFSSGAGTANLDLAIRIKFFAGVLKRSNRFLHGLPLSQVAAGGVLTTTGPWSTALAAWVTEVENNCSIATKLHGAVVPPFYTFTAITGSSEVLIAEGKKVGRPFGLPHGRRLIA